MNKIVITIMTVQAIATLYIWHSFKSFRCDVAQGYYAERTHTYPYFRQNGYEPIYEGEDNVLLTKEWIGKCDYILPGEWPSLRWNEL